MFVKHFLLHKIQLGTSDEVQFLTTGGGSFDDMKLVQLEAVPQEGVCKTACYRLSGRSDMTLAHRMSLMNENGKLNKRMSLFSTHHVRHNA